MLRQFKGLKWINNVPHFLLFDFNNNKLEIKKINNKINMTKTKNRKCNGYYDLLERKYKVCPNYFDEISNEIKQCSTCHKLSGFYNCLGCDGSLCRADNEIAQKFCNQKHIVYIALFGDYKLKVGIAAEYRKFSRILEQGAIVSMFIAETPNGKIARFLEHLIAKRGYTLQVQINYKIKNLIIDKNRKEIESFLLEQYYIIKNEIPSTLRKYLIYPKINYCEKINEINKKIFKPKNSQISIFKDQREERTYNIDYNLQVDKICGKILNIVGTILIVKTSNNQIIAYDTKCFEGFIVNLDII